MDIEHDEVVTTDEVEPGSGLVLASETLPRSINLLPLEARPFFPGQAIPLLLDPDMAQ